MGKWTEAGFVANSLSKYTEDLQKIFIEAFGDDFLLDPTLPQGILITRIAELLYGTDMDGIEGFSRMNINVASGIILDIIGGQRGLPRGLGTPQKAFVQITTVNSTFNPFTIPQGQVFELVNGNGNFIAESPITITQQVTIIPLTYSESGNSGASVGQKMQTNNLGQIQDIEITSLVDGEDIESDIDYRKRIKTSYPVANNTIEFVENKMMETQLVKLVGHNYNDTAETVDGLPPYTTEWMAVQKEDADLNLFKTEMGTTIINNKVPGSPTAGNTTVAVTDIFGTPKTVQFTIPTEVKLQISVRVETPEATGFIDLTEAPQIRETIAAYINSLEIGDDVSYSRCLAPLTADANFDVVFFKIRQLPNAPEWAQNIQYQVGDIVSYDGIYYQATQTPEGMPGVDPAWVVYDEGWLSFQNYPINSRQYATIDVSNISIGV